MYAALDGLPCLAEVFQESRIINRFHNEPWLVAFDLARPVNLLDLTGLWPTRTGRASTAISSGPRPRARRWSKSIHEAYPDLHGLYYASSMNAGQPSVALYARAEAVGAIPATPRFHRALSDATWLVALRNAAAALHYAVV